MIIRIADAKAEITRLTGELSAVTETAKSHAQEIAALIVERDTAQADALVLRTGDVSALAAVTAQLDAALSANAALDSERASAADKALEIVAAIGFTASVPVAPDTTGDVFSQLNAMPHGAARQQFLLKNWNQLNSR